MEILLQCEGGDYEDGFLPADLFISGVVGFSLRRARDGS
jgi:hypothetical protein